jgi:y4mF family transcriptional regulator
MRGGIMNSHEATRIRDGEALGEFVRNRRKELGLTQEELAESANVSRKFLYELEKGKSSLRLDKVIYVLLSLSADIYAKAR